MITYSSSVCIFAVAICLELIKGSNQTEDIPIVSPIVDSLPTTDECTPDIANILDVDMNNIPAFANCAKDVAALKNKTHPDSNKNTSELITSYGYPLEVHEVTTGDYYILAVHRIPKPGKIPVFLQHGLGGCSDNYLLKGNDSLAFLLSNVGYDVWLGNFRGTKYSRGHKTLQWNNPTNFSYWDFSFHELGKYDIPAVLLYIKKNTTKSILYVGHSMGTTSFFIGLDQVPDVYNKNILAAILLAPTGFLGRSTSVLKFISPLVTKVDPQYLDTVLRGRIDDPGEFLKLINTSLADICTPIATRCTICDQLLFAVMGFDAPQVNYTDVPNQAGRFPNTVSVKTLYHYAQNLAKCTFKQFDYGPKKNEQIYGTNEAPDYSLKNCKVPVYSMYANFDILSRPKDVSRTLALLPEGVLKENIKVDWYYFIHPDFLIAKDAYELVYKDILRIFKTTTG